MTLKLTPNSQIIPLKTNSIASLRLFCFPYAGASSYIFRSWRNRAPETIEICPIELPGRGTKINLTPLKRIEPLVEEIALEILPYLDKPFAFFGHSMGALVSFELAHFIRSQYNLEPVYLFISSRHAPQLKEREDPIHDLPELELIERLSLLNGTPEEVLKNNELMSILMPIIRADFAILENYTYIQKPLLNCPISVFSGLQDRELLREKLQAWQEQTLNSCSLKMFPGDHFFINSSQSLLTELIQQLNIYR